MNIAIDSYHAGPNGMIPPVLGLELAIILIIHTPPGNMLIRTTPLAAGLWLVPVPLALAILVLDHLRKWLARRSRQRPTP